MSLLFIGPSHQAPLYRRRAEPSVVIEELPLDEQEEPPKPKASSELSTGHSAHQQAISASNITAMPLGPASAEATGEPATAPKPDPMLLASPSPSVAAAAAAAPTAAASRLSSDQPQAAKQAESYTAAAGFHVWLRSSQEAAQWAR